MEWLNDKQTISYIEYSLIGAIVLVGLIVLYRYFNKKSEVDTRTSFSEPQLTEEQVREMMKGSGGKKRKMKKPARRQSK
jgi:uncharacterized protein YneF (UPF0154 family)